VGTLGRRTLKDRSGHFYTDEEVLREEGVVDLSRYRLAASDDDLAPNFYLASTPLPAG
jgi:citronellol/citronellal dehydrogenase